MKQLKVVLGDHGCGPSDDGAGVYVDGEMVKGVTSIATSVQAGGLTQVTITLTGRDCHIVQHMTEVEITSLDSDTRRYAAVPHSQR